MQLVHRAARARIATRRRAAAALGALVLTGGLAACSDSDSSSSAPVERGAGGGIGAPVRLANCADWQDAGARDRMVTLKQIRSFAGGPAGQTKGHGNTLDDDKAYKLFEGYCKREYARGFKLYKLYTRAAAFSDQQR